MASGGAEADDGGIPLDIDSMHMLLQVEHEQIQKRTFTNWINAQLAKRCPPSFVSDLFSDLRHGSQLLDLLEVMSGQPMKRQKGHGLFQQRADIETALSFLKKKSIKLVNINIPDIIDGQSSIILGLVWTIILHCHIEELASTLSFSSRHSSLDSLTSLDSWSGSPVPSSPVPLGQTPPLHRHFRISAKKALLMWVRDQCQRVGSSVSVKDFKSSWRSGEAFLVVLCSLRPQLVDLSLVQSRSNQENLEEAFHLAERELHIPRLLEPQDVDVKDPDEKSIMTYVAQFLQYSNDMPAPDDHLQLFPLDQPPCSSPVNLSAHVTPAIAVSPSRQVSPNVRAQEMTSWLQRAYQELSDAWLATEESSYAEKCQVFQNLAGSFNEQRRPVMTHLATIRHRPELSREQHALRTAWDCLEEELQRCKTELDLSLPPPLDIVAVWLQRAEAAIAEDGGRGKDHADAAKEARAQHDTLKTLIQEMGHHVQTLDAYHNMDNTGNVVVPPEKFDEIKRRVTHIQVSAKYKEIKLEYQESCHSVLDLLGQICAKVQTWKAPCRSKEAVHGLLQDWNETVEHQGMLLILMEALQNLKEKANAYTSTAALSEDSQLVLRQVKEAESEVELATQTVMTVRGMMERMVSAWETYSKCLTSLQTWLEQTTRSQTQSAAEISERTSCQAQLNEVGNFLIEVTETSTSCSLAEQLRKVNMQWAEYMKRIKFELPSGPSVGPPCLQMVHSLTQEASWLLRQPLEVASVPLKANRQKLQLLRKKMADMDLSCLSPSPDFQTSHIENFQHTLPQMLVEAERTCGELQRAASRLEGHLAEMDRWSTDALDCFQHLKEKEHRGRSAPEPRGLISRGLQLENQVVTGEQGLQDLVARVQKTSPLCHLSTSGMQDRISEALSLCQEILGMFSSLGFKRHVGEPVYQTPRQPEAGLFVMARTKHVDQIGNVTLETQDPIQPSPRISSHIPQQRTRCVQALPETRHMNTQDETATVIPCVEIQMLPQPLRESVPLIHPILTPTPVGQMSQQRPVVSKHKTSPFTEEKESSSPSQTYLSKFRTREQPTAPQSNKTSPLPPAVVHSEVHSKAQSMAKSRLERVRFRLQGRIQQAIRLFGGKEISESQAKKKQRALKILQTAVLEEFLDAVEGFGAFCSGPQLQDLMLLSDSVRKQWEDVHREMAAFVPILEFKLKEGEQSLCAVQCVTYTNTHHKPTGQTDHDLQQKEAATEGAASIEEHVKSLQELRETLTPCKSSCLATDQLKESEINVIVVRGDTVETRQDAEWTIIPETVAPPEEEHPLDQEVLKRYRTSCLVFQSQLQKNKQHLEQVIPHPVTISTLLNQKKQLQTLKQETEALWFEFELQYAQLSQSSHPMTREVERAREQLSQGWRGQQMCLQSRMTSLQSTADLMKSAHDHMELITQKLDRIIRESVDISSFTLADPGLVSDLKEMDDKLQSEMKKLSEQSSENEIQQTEVTSPSSRHQALHSSVNHLKQLRGKLEKVHSAAQALDRFLATVREVRAEIPTLLSSQDPSGQQNEAVWEQERHSWQAAMQQRLQTAAEQSGGVDSSLRAAGLTLTMDGATVMCQDVVTSLSKDIVDVEVKLIKSRKRGSQDKSDPVVKEQMQGNEESNPVGVHQTKTVDTSPQQGGAQEQEHPPPSTAEEKSRLEAKRSRQGGEEDTKTQRVEEHKSETWRSEGGVKDQRSSELKKGGKEKESLVQRRDALLGALREIRAAAEQLALQEPTLPALQHRTHVLTELKSHLTVLLSEKQLVQDAFSSGIPDVGQTREVEDLWEETTRTVTERLDQCCGLTQLLKRFQSLRGELSGTLQRAESIISEQASYVGKDNLQRLHTKIQETKAELSGLGDRIEDVRNVCRQLHTHLRHRPEHTIVPFESEADALMDQWLDISERTDSHLENLHLGLTLWEGVLQLGAEVESWTTSQLAVFAQSLSFQTEDGIKTLQNDIVAQEERMDHFHQRAAEIQSLLHSTELPVELQVVEIQMRKKMEQLKELVSEAEDYRQMVAAKGQITVRMAECFNSLQKIQDSLVTLSGSDIATVLAKLKELCWQLQIQDEQAGSLLEDLRVMATVASPNSLQSLCADGSRLQEKVRNTHQLFSETEEQTARNIQDLDRMQRECEHLEKWLQAAEEKAVKEEDLGLLQEEVLQQRVRTELLSQLVSALQNSTLQQSVLVEESSKLLEQYHNFHTNIQCSSKDKQQTLSRDIEVFQALSKSTQAWVEDLRQAADSPLSLGIQSPVEQKLHRAQALVSVTAEGEARLEELRVTGNSLSQRVCDRVDLKQEVKETIQKTEEQWTNLLQSLEPYYRVLQTGSELTSSYLAQRQEACCRVEALQRQTAQLPTLFPWPGTAERRHACLLARHLWDETESLQLTLTTLAEKRRDLAEQTNDTIWKDSSWVELDTCWSGLMAELKGVCSCLEEGVINEECFGQLLQDCDHELMSLQETMSACQAQKESSVGLLTDVPALEALLQKVTSVEKDLLQLVALKDSLTSSSTAEAQASLSQQVTNLQNHKRVLDSSIREKLTLLKENGNQRVQQVKEEVACVQAALKDLTENVQMLYGNHEVSPDISQLKQQWGTIQLCDTRLTELVARLYNMQKTGESKEMLHADAILAVDAVTKDLDSIKSIFLQKKHECAESTAVRVKQAISQLQQWSRTVQAQPSSPSQAALDEGLQLQQSLREVLSEKDFLLNCLGSKVSKSLEKEASNALSESTLALEMLSKYLVSQGPSDLDNEDLTGESVEESFRSECGAPHSAPPDESMVTCPPAFPFPSADDKMENSGTDQNDNKMKSKGCLDFTEPITNTSGESNVVADATKQDQAESLMQTSKEQTFVPNHVPSADIPEFSNSKTQQQSQQLTHAKSLTAQQDNTEPLQENTDSKLSATGTASNKDVSLAHCVTSLVGLPSTKPDNILLSNPENVFEHLIAQSQMFQEQEKHCEDLRTTPKKVLTVVLEMEPQDMQINVNVGPDVLGCSQKTELYDAELMAVSGTDSTEKKSGLLMLTGPESDKPDLKKHNLAAQSEIFKAGPVVHRDEDISSNKVFTIMLDMEQSEHDWASTFDSLRCLKGSEPCDAKLSDVSSTGIPEKKSGLFTALISPESVLRSHYLKSLKSHVSQVEDSLSESTELEEVKSTSAKLSSTENSDTHELMRSEVLNSSSSCETFSECQLTGAHAAETKFVAVKPEEVTDFCHMEEQTVSSVLCTVEASVQLRDTLTEMQIPAGDSKELMGADTAQSTDIGHAEMAEGEEVEETSDPKCPESKDSKMVQTQDSALLLEEECDSGLPSSLEDTREMQEQPEIQEGMEAEKTTLVSSADLGAGEATGGSSSSSCKRRSTMQDILSEIESLVERRNINRTPHMDLNWYLKCCPGESEIQLVRTVQRVLACRYQPAQLDVTAMAKQLQEAEEYRRCVQEQVAIIKGISAARVCDPDALKSAEGQWNAALLDASATVQVKAAQLEKVKQYHKQMKMIRAFLEVVATEKEKSSLNALGSSAVQTDKLHTLLQTMKGKKGMMEELIQLRSQLSVLLSDAESLAALLAQLGDVQEEWRLLEGSIKRALGHASNSTSQFVLLMKEADQLKAKLEALQKSSFQSSDNKSDLELVCLTTDLKLYIQLYLDLQSQSDALVHFCLGQKEQGEIQHNLQELGSLLNVTKRKLDTFSCRSNSSVKVNKQLQDLIIWAKKAENHISIGQRLALFPEEAHIQIVEMKKFQTDILSRHSKLQVQVEELKDLTADTEKEESNQVLKTIEELYEAVADSVDHVLDKMKKNLRERQKLLIQLSSLDAWLAKKYAARDPCTHIESVSRADIQKLESELECHKLDTVEIESQLNLLEVMAESCKDISVGLSPGESRHLVNRLSGLWMQLDGLLAHEKATSWELEGLIHEQTFSDEELSNIQGSLKIISTDLNQQRSPLKQETLSTIVHLKHMLMEHQCQVQELQHCQEDKRSSLLYTIGELQDRCRAVSLIAFEQDQYFHLRRQMEESMDIAKEQMQHIRDDTISMDERFTLCQTLLVELPLAKTRCQKTSDQLEAIAHELLPAELNSERQRIHSTMETLLSWEHSVTDDIKNLEAKLLFGLQFSIELPALIDLFQRTRVELEAAKPVSPDEKAIDDALQKYWVIWRNMESGIRVLEGLGRKEKINLKNYKELHSFRDAAMQECRLRMENLSQARESLKDYHLAAQGAIGFLRNAEATFLSAPGGFLDCSEEQQQTQQALAALEDGLQACSCHLVELVPQQPCLSRPKIEQLHIRILSQLLVGRAVLEAQAQLRLESLQRCSIRQQSHRRFHEDVQQRLSRFEARLSECAATQVTSYDKCVAQQKRATLMMEDLHSLSRKIEELRAGCPRRRCGVGKDSELGALWRRWASLRRGIGLLMAHTEQKGEEWKDITTSMEQCCSILASLQAEVPDSSTVTSTQEEPQELLAHAELHQAGLEQVQQALASLQHRLEHALSLSTSQDPISPGPAGKTLVKIQENVRSLKERNLLVVAAAQAEENERLQVQDKIEEVEKHVSATLLMLEACSDPSKQQELKKDLSSQKAKLQCIMEGVRSRYAEIPADISRRLQVVHLSLQRSEEKHIENSKVVQKLVGQVAELSSGLEKVEVLLEQRSPTVSEAQNVLKRVWDNLDAWHSCLMLLESEVQDLAEEQTDQVHLLMDQLTEPLQLYQKIAQRAEQRTSFLSKIPTSLQEFEDILCSATCWLDEAQSWLTAPCSFTTARSLQSHANSLQLVLDDSKRIRDTLQDFRPVLAEISAVCDIRAQEGRLDQNDQQIQKMQRNILEPLEQLLQTVAVVEAMEAELKTMEKNVPKIRTILSSMENSNIPLTEHVHNRQVILANVQLMRRTLEDMEKCRTELHLPQGAEESPLIFSRAKLLLQSLTELENLTQQQTSRLEQEDFEASNSVEEEEEEDDESCHSSSSDTLTCSVPEDPEETLGASDVQSDAIAEITPPSDVQELESLSHHFSSKVETSSKGAVLLSVKSWFDSCDFGATAEFVTMDSTADAAEASATTESLTTAATPAADDGFTVTDVLELCESPTDESLVSDPHTKSIQAAAAVEDTGLTPASPVTPFTAIRASVNFTEERDDLSSSTDLDTPSGLKTQGEVSTSQSSVEESKAALESKVPVSLTRHEDGKEQISQLYTQLSPKRTTLKKVEEYQTLISSEDGGAHEKELASNLLCFLDELDLGQSEISSLKDARSLEQCVLGRHLRESPGEKAKLQQVSRFLLQGLTRLLELGEERIREMQMNQVHNCSQHQAILCGHQKLLQFLRSQLAFVQHLFQCEPEALRYQEDERVQLEIRAKALQQQAVEQEAASQRRLQEWTHWEDNCGRLGRVLDEFDAFIISGEPEGEDDEDFVVQHRLDACQQTLVQLDESRAALGLLLDQRNVLRMYPAFAASVSQTGGALELRWRAAYSRTEQEIQRCRDIQDSRARFQTNFASVSKWLVGANKHLKSLSDLADTCDLNQECLHSRLIQLLDFCMEVEAMSVQRASVSRTVTRLIQLREDHCLGLRAQLAQLDVSWSQLTSDLSTIQDQLQQRLLAAWPPVQLLSDLEDWLKMLEGRLSQEKAMVLKAKDAAQVIEALQHYQELKAGVDSGQLLLDFLCQHGPQAGAANDQALQSERTMFAETLGSLRLQWLHLQWELEKQVHEAEQIHHTCADRERRLQQLHGWIVQQKKQLNQWKQSTSQTLVQKALLDWEAAVGRAREVAEALQELKATRVHAEKEEAQPCDIAFSNQAESISHACEDLGQQMEALRPTLQQTVAEWSCFDQDLREVTLLTTRVRCALQHQQAPLLSLKQAEEYMHLLQQLQEKAGKGGDLWTGVEKSYQSLVKTLHHGVVQALDEQVEGERKWWKDVVWELKEEHVKTGETLSLWQEYSLLSDHCSLHLQNLWHQWEELLSSSSSPERDTQALVYSVKKLQDAAESLKSIVDDALAASKRLMERLEPSATNLVQSEISLLSHDVLLLNQAVKGKKKSLEEDLEEQKRFHAHLEALDKQMQSMRPKLEDGLTDTDSVEQVLLELSALFPSLVDIREMSGSMNLKNQETERLHMLSREWTESMIRISDMNGELRAEHQLSQNFQEKSTNLMSIQEKLEQELVSRKPQSHSNLQEMLTVHQRLQAEIVTGHQLLQGLICDAVMATENETKEKRSEVMAQVASLKTGWINSVAVVGQCRSLVKEQLHQWRTYRHGLKVLWKLLKNVDILVPPPGPAPCALQQLQSCADLCQCVEEALGLHSTVYAQTLAAGRYLCETVAEGECLSRLQAECQVIDEAWERATSLLRSRSDLVNTTVQKWSECQDEIINIMSGLDELQTRLKQQLPERSEGSEDETFIQESERSLQHLASGMKELATMKTDLSQYVTAGDSALLEQQLEQLHSQWEELCMKVSLRRQEIADSLNAWTIFNDKNREFCNWLTQMENKVCHSGDLSIKDMVEKLKKDCMEEINLFSENKSHLKQLGEQLLLASDEAKHTQVHSSLQEVSQRWHNLFHQIEARVKKLKETLVTVQQLDKNMSNLRLWLSRIEAELSRPITYNVCHLQEIQRRLAEQQELQKDIEQHTEGVASVLSLCDVLLRDEDAAGDAEAEGDSLQETSRSLDQRWRTICAMALDRRLRIEETWRLWCKFLDDYSQFEDWLKMAEHTAANPNSADVLYTVAKEELKTFEGFQRQVHEHLTQLELLNNQYRRLARENRTDRASQLKAMVHEGNRRWDTLRRRVAAILRRLKHFTSQREEFERTRESMLAWLAELDLQLTNVEHFSESDIHHKIQQLNSFQKEITLNTECIDGLIVFGESLIQKSSPQDAALIEDELQELHSYCQEVFSRLVRFHQRLSQPPIITVEPELSGITFCLESSLELIGRPWLGRSQGSLPATPTHLLESPLERSGRETPVSVDSLPLEWDHTGDVGGSSSHEDEDEEEEGTYFSALSAPGRSKVVHESPRWPPPADTEPQPLQQDAQGHTEAPPALASTPLQQGYLRLMSQCSGSIENIRRVSLILDDKEQPEELGLTGLMASDKQSGVIERWELLQAQPSSDQQADPREPQWLASDLDNITSWLETVILELGCPQQSDPAASVEDMEARAKELKELQKTFTHYKSVMLSVNLRAQKSPDLQERLVRMNRDWSRACTGLQQRDTSLRKTLMHCQDFHETLHSLLLWLAHAESRRYTVDISCPDTPVRALQQHHKTLTDLQAELRDRRAQQASLQALWSQLQPQDKAEENDEAREKLHVTGSKLKLLLREVEQDLSSLQQRLGCESVSDVQGQSASAEVTHSKKGSSTQREMREPSSPPRSFFSRVLRAAFPLHLLLLLLLLLPCLILLSASDSSCTVTNNFARSFYPMLHYTNGPPPT